MSKALPSISGNMWCALLLLSQQSMRLTALRVVVDVVAVAVGQETGYAARLSGAGSKHHQKEHHSVAQSHKADRAEVVDLHVSCSLYVKKTKENEWGEGYVGF